MTYLSFQKIYLGRGLELNLDVAIVFREGATSLGEMDFNSVRGSRRTWKYEVFVSFRGEDTRHGFTSHLFSALQRRGIFPFKDDTRIQKGDSISQVLLNAIEQSRISIVIFSKHYADSTWCLEELAKISEVIFEPGYFVLPIFYDVDPSEVQNQSGNFKEAFDKHEQNFSDNMDKVQRWRIALNQVSNLSGWDVRTRSGLEVINYIVIQTISKLGHRFSSLADDLVGMQSRVEAFENFLNLESDEVRFVGIWGLPGIGKTTLAAVVYDKISYQFDFCCFLPDVGRVQKRFGTFHLRQEVHSQILGRNLKLKRSHVLMQDPKLWHSVGKTLFVVDNVDCVSQLVAALVGKPERFHPGSRIIITTRDEHILKRQGVENVFKVELLKDHEALQLFCRKVFKRDDPLSEFQELTHNLLQYAQALPLAITVLGSHLFRQQKSQWRDELVRLRATPHAGVMGVLETSYFQLKEQEKAVFLDISCFFTGADVNYVKKILSYCHFHPQIGIKNLLDKSLISIVNGTLWMHDLLQELGWKIVEGKFPEDPAKWSRLWSYKDLQVVSKGREEVKAIVLNQEVPKDILLNAEALSQMSHLRLLILLDMKFLGNLSNLSNELRFFSWHKFPFSYLPPTFWPHKLVEWIMPDSNIRQLWKGTKFLPSLTSIDLSGSKSLVETPDFLHVQNLERLNLEGCIGLLRVDLSIGNLKKLQFFNLKKCTHLISIPNNIFLSSSLETLNLFHCSRLRKINSVKYLNRTEPHDQSEAEPPHRQHGSLC